MKKKEEKKKKTRGEKESYNCHCIDQGSNENGGSRCRLAITKRLKVSLLIFHKN